MKITTTTHLPASRSEVFRLLYDSKLPTRAPLLLRLVAPAPRACRLVVGRGEGARRQCVTSRGAIDQRVTEWREGEVLAFEMVGENVGLASWVESLRDRFTLEATESGTRLTRTSVLEPRGNFKWFKALLLYPAVKAIHRFVFANGRRLLDVSPLRVAPHAG